MACTGASQPRIVAAAISPLETGNLHVRRVWFEHLKASANNLLEVDFWSGGDLFGCLLTVKEILDGAVRRIKLVWRTSGHTHLQPEASIVRS